jgi:hypothetical protein
MVKQSKKLMITLSLSTYVIQCGIHFCICTDDKKQRKDFYFISTYDEFIKLVYTEQFGEQKLLQYY